MIWLQSNDKYDALAEYDHIEGKFTIASRKTLGSKAPSKTDGSFAILSGVFVALYNFEQQLFLRVGNNTVLLADDIIVTVSGNANNRLLLVKKAGQEIVRLNYILDMSNQFPNDLTHSIEDEDFDFGLFISNISKNNKRKRILLGLD